MGEGKAGNVIEYLDNLIAKGKATNAAIAPLKIAFGKVMQVIDGDDWREVDVKKIDVEDYMSRFANLTIGTYSPQSLTSYKSRVTRALNWYNQFLEKPGWTPEVARRGSPNQGKVKKTNNADVKRKTVPTPPNQGMQSDADQNLGTGFAKVAGRVIYPYPLLDGQLVHVSLPVKLSKRDAKRLSAFIESIAVDDEDLKS